LQSVELRSFSSTLETKLRVMTQIQYGMSIASVRNDEKKKKPTSRTCVCVVVYLEKKQVNENCMLN